MLAERDFQERFVGLLTGMDISFPHMMFLKQLFCIDQQLSQDGIVLIRCHQYYILLMFGFNFNDFGGFNMGGGGDDEDDQMDGEVDNNRLYELLGVTKEATTEQIKAAFQKLEEEHKNSEEPDGFEQIKEAYEVLSNPQDRQMYDRFGEGGPSQNDIMQMMFGGGGGLPKGPQQKQKSQPLKQLLEVTLEQVYNGQTVNVTVKRYRLCKGCNGAGGADVKKCTDCKGRGQVVRMIPLGPGMMQQLAQTCEVCKGEGQIIAEESKCKQCEGKQVNQEQVKIDVKVPEGISSRQPIVVAGEGHQLPEMLVGDLIFVVEVKPDETFVRNGNDLFLKKNILLIEGITGVVFNLNHLDKKVYTIESPPHEIIGDRSKKVIRNLGMPLYKNSDEHGNLIIEFHLVMPEKGSINEASIKELATILPGELSQKPKDHNFELLEDFDHADLNTNQEGGGGNQDDDDDDDGQPGGVQCASQ